MRIKSIQLKGFRNLKKTELHFEKPGLYAFVGPNGHGKTNLLESFFLLAISKSFRTNENLDLMGFKEDFCSMKAVVESQDSESELEMVVTRKPVKRVVKLNGVQKKAADYIGHLKVVFFSPDDVGLIHLSPAFRRRYLDLLISQLDPGYMRKLMEYQQVLKQRNQLLKRIQEGVAHEPELDFWDEKLAALAFFLSEKRREVVGDLSSRASTYYQDISDQQDELRLEYEAKARAETMEDYLASYRSSHRRDLILGSTQLGPHRDDLKFFCNDQDMAHFSSRGEGRSLLLTLKFAEVELLKEVYGELPVLLLDDVFSELDDKRQRLLFDLVNATQVFVTTTHEEFLSVVSGEKHILRVKDGEISS